MSFPREAQADTPDDYHPESTAESFSFSREIDDHESEVPITKDVLGGKGYGLVELTKLGLPVPPGFILTTAAWCETRDGGNTIPTQVARELHQQLERLEQKTGKRLGDPVRPLAVAVRSGAPISMPGVMITLLNIGLNDQTVEALGKNIGDQNAWKAYLEMMIHLGHQAYGISPEILDHVRKDSLTKYAVARVSDLPVDELQAMVERVKAIYSQTGIEFPQDPNKQIFAAVRAVFRSWDTPEALHYRKQHSISDTLGTAAIIQEIVWGLREKEGAGAGVLLTRNIQTGEHISSVAFVPGKQGTAVVGDLGTHGQYRVDDLPIGSAAKQELAHITASLEAHYPLPQDVEFTFDGDRVWVLQTRDVPLQPLAHYRVLRELIANGMLTTDRAIRSITILELQSLLTPPLDPEEVARKRHAGDVITAGIPISLGNASGIATTSMDEIRDNAQTQFILVAPSISLPMLTDLMNRRIYPNVIGVVAGNGGIGSHIARVATRLGDHMPIVFGTETQHIEVHNVLTIDGSSGEVFAGLIPRQTDGRSQLLTPEEHAEIRRWHEARMNNPWAYVTSEERLEDFRAIAQQAHEHAAQTYQSPKARVQEVINALIPMEIRSNYTPFKPSEIHRMKELIAGILAKGNHVTLRTCYNPDRQGKTPWVMLTSMEQTDSFFSDPSFDWKYGGYSSWHTDPELTEILLGEIPSNKMNEDPVIQYNFASWTVTCTERGDIILQIRPHTAHLRGHEDVGPDDLIAYRFVVDPAGQGSTRSSEPIFGANLATDTQAQTASRYVIKHVLEWWKKYDIPKRLAAMSFVYPQPTYAVPVLEGQARINGDEWIGIYGMKIDDVQERNKHDTPLD